ncbi:MaoC family dehydratase [Nakamurella endophytica]|uniref:MaoC family dehydratase n=1 Tax=Nakamurella endophytica TaxID=1748367 RepID=UPI001667C186|nr:MaoC family dehydratase [Nakamurella endophytica]
MTEPRVFAGPDELAAAAGERLGPGEGVVVSQDRIRAFADATGDHQWIHLDADRAAAGPFGGTVAHGYLTLSLLPVLVRGLYRVDGAALVINYGLDRVRFPAPVRAGSTVRATAVLGAATPVAGGWQLVATVSVTADGATKPCCVAETVSRYLAG